MNGVLRLLSSAASPSRPDSQPLTWPPTQSSPDPTQPLFVKKDRPKPVTDELNHSRTFSNFSTPDNSSPSSSSFNRISRKSVNLSESGWKRNSGPLNTRDELLMSLMASEAVIDSRGFDILTAEEVEDLKKEHQLLTSRLGAMTKKLALETKIRDAAVSLSKVNASHKKLSQQTTDQLNAANARVDSAQKEYWKVSNRVNEVHKKLMEHRAGVLSFSVRSMEKQMAPPPQLADDSGYDSSTRSALTSPTSSSFAGGIPSKSRFDGAHLFAGHADTIVPRVKLSSEAAAAEIASLEEKLKAAKDSLTAAGKKQAEMARELSMIRLEKQEVETMMGMDLQAAEETIAALEKEIPRLEELDSEVRQLREEKGTWERERFELKERERETEVLQTRLANMEAKTGEAADGAEKVLAEIRESSQRQLEEKESQIEMLQQQWEADRTAWEQERADLEDEKMEDLARLQDEMDRLREDDEGGLRQAGEELDAGLSILQDLIKKYGIVLFSRDSTLQGLLNAIGMHIQTVHTKLETYARAESEWDVLRRRLEDDVRSGLDKRETLSRELDDARRERDAVKTGALTMQNVSPDSHSRTASSATTLISDDINGNTDVHRIISILQPLWAILPSPETRAAKFGSTNQRTYRTASPPIPVGSNVTSLSELDVRSLKTLYETTRQAATSSPGKNNGAFTIEAFAGQVQALINDDRALIERLVRFAQAHDMLKKNADRAQKLAREGTLALETYQKQVRTLEERNMGMVAKQAAFQDEIQHLQITIDRLESEKRQLESLAAEQAETCAQLNEANNTLSARALTLAEEAAKAPEMVRKQLEAQLNECKRALDIAKGEVEEMRSSEQSQRIVLLDELNEMQTENTNLRAQLRAVKK
ncbi:hypothetical protein BYT27DRAFT_7191636 [Phlegmacium glaucopus]|nr:hypothetical protein BYT27DRAFT_7191636 [Phlegmacium glaucopus]